MPWFVGYVYRFVHTGRRIEKSNSFVVFSGIRFGTMQLA